MSFPGVEPGVGIKLTDTDAWGDGTSTSSRPSRHHQQPSISTCGRPSTSTTQSSGSMSVGSSEDRQGSRKPSSPPRKSSDIFRRFRGRAVLQEDFIERRSLTPHGLLSPGPQHRDPDSPEERESTGTMLRGLQVNGKPAFGVDLNESIRLAPMKIRISHRGSSTSYRTFPLSVYKCCDFIRRSAADPSLFSSPGDASNVSHLLTIFNTPPYGEDFSFSDPAPVSNHQYTIHDAGRIILLYLQDLPKPLVSSSVAKSWIMLARQEGAIQPTCSRPLETGLDFWAEALNRLPTANRNLTKHLLTLFAETVTRRDSKGRPHISEADARNLASAVSRAMFHTDESGKGKNSTKNVHATLALAFLLKKRGEYVASLGKGEKGEEKEEPGFLPSTREILEWKRQ
ncbi:Rho GTPase activation protein [Cercophora newfieldiana]|uniref:Rho GTPase activation protein n=1 Tax=Cercophora newfieldiana TaxID=92897 RepID=A0AA40CLH7_9PEZI|nr:Rho GTPase activation protein [Cercophora newfieldiana]